MTRVACKFQKSKLQITKISTRLNFETWAFVIWDLPRRAVAYLRLHRLAGRLAFSRVRSAMEDRDALPQRNCGRFSRPSPEPGAIEKNRRTCAGSANAPTARNLFIRAFLANASVPQAENPSQFYSRPLATTAVLYTPSSAQNSRQKMFTCHIASTYSDMMIC